MGFSWFPVQLFSLCFFFFYLFFFFSFLSYFCFLFTQLFFHEKIENSWTFSIYTNFFQMHELLGLNFFSKSMDNFLNTVNFFYNSMNFFKFMNFSYFNNFFKFLILKFCEIFSNSRTFLIFMNFTKGHQLLAPKRWKWPL